MPDQTNYRNTRTQPTMQTGQNAGFRQPPPTPPTPPTPPPVTTAYPPTDAVPPTVSSRYYLAGYLQQFIGRLVRVEFSLGTTGALNDRIGTLMEIGASYIVLKQFPSNDLLIGDLYSVKYVNVYDVDNG